MSRSRLPDQQELHQHRDEQDHRQDVVDHRADPDPGGFQDLEGQQQDGRRDEDIPGGELQVLTGNTGSWRPCRSNSRRE